MTQDMAARDESFSVLICTRDRLPVLRETVDLVLERLAAFRNSRLVIVDNGSQDGTAEYLATLSHLHKNVDVATESRPGLYNAKARAISMATGAFFLFYDDDIIPGKGWPRAIIEELHSSPDVGVVGTSVVPVWHGERPHWMTPRIERNVFAAAVKSRVVCQFPCYPYGCSAAFRMSEVARLFLTPERRRVQLGLGSGSGAVGGEDWDLPEIYIQNGFKAVILDSVSVGHRVMAEKVSKKWVIEKYEADGRLHVRYARLANKPLLTARVIVHLLTFPLWSVLSGAGKCLRDQDHPLIMTFRVFCARGRGLWYELLFGERHARFPFKPEETANRKLLVFPLSGTTKAG